MTGTTEHTGIMELLIKAHTPFGDENYDFFAEAGSPARVSFRGNTVEIPEYLLFDNEDCHRNV